MTSFYFFRLCFLYFIFVLIHVIFSKIVNRFISKLKQNKLIDWLERTTCSLKIQVGIFFLYCVYLKYLLSIIAVSSNVELPPFLWYQCYQDSSYALPVLTLHFMFNIFTKFRYLDHNLDRNSDI